VAEALLLALTEKLQTKGVLQAGRQAGRRLCPLKVIRRWSCRSRRPQLQGRTEIAGGSDGAGTAGGGNTTGGLAVSSTVCCRYRPSNLSGPGSILPRAVWPKGSTSSSRPTSAAASRGRCGNPLQQSMTPLMWESYLGQGATCYWHAATYVLLLTDNSARSPASHWCCWATVLLASTLCENAAGGGGGRPTPHSTTWHAQRPLTTSHHCPYTNPTKQRCSSTQPLPCQALESTGGAALWPLPLPGSLMGPGPLSLLPPCCCR
jgi:hypothetical protein